ncbi:MAG: hypothetical protein M1830_001646 [Pleopsidium flavum]|nr:MAG: hypothetical protein M1830_001646 [Pleopsidium flavum]
MPSELDPLLPRNQPAPEISHDGFLKQANNGYEGLGDSPSPSSIVRSSLRTFCALFTIVVSFALVIALVFPGGLRSPTDNRQEDNNTTIAARVDKLLSDTPLIDGHNDLATLIRYLYKNQLYDRNFTEPFEKGGLKFHVDLPRLRKGKVGGVFWSAYVNCPQNGTDFSDDNYAEAVSTTLSQLDLLHRLRDAYPITFSTPHLNASTALHVFNINNQVISPLIIEGLHQIGNSFSNLRLYHLLGVRYATLTHNCHNAFADAALITNSSGSTIAAPSYWGGISERGRDAVKEMNRLGMIVDLSHVSKDTMLDVLGGRPEKWRGSAAPIIFSHSSAYALCPHPRNVPDDVLKLVKKTNSIVMINFNPEFISCVPANASTGIPDLYPPNSTLHQVVRHIKYVGDLIGYDHVGLGSDFDGIFDTPKGLDDVSKFPDLVAEMLRFGVSDEDAAKVVGRNILRVWGNVDEVAQKMRVAGTKPAEDRVELRSDNLMYG